MLPRVRIFKEIVDYFKKWMNDQYTEPTMDEIFCWYIKVKGRKLYQDYPHLTMELSSAAKAQDNTGWNNMIRVQIPHHCNKRQPDYLK